jgi:ketol-acid reductoisomerase
MAPFAFKPLMEKIYRDDDVSLAPLEGKRVAVIGYGIQGKAQAANMRDSGVDVLIGTRPPEESRSRAEAEADGFEAVSIAEAVQRADILSIQLADPARRCGAISSR